MFGISCPWCRFYCACILIIQLSDRRNGDLVLLWSYTYVFSSQLKEICACQNPKLSICGIHLMSRKHSIWRSAVLQKLFYCKKKKKSEIKDVCIVYAFSLEKRDKVRLLKQGCSYSIYHLLCFQTNLMDQAFTRKDSESCWNTPLIQGWNRIPLSSLFVMGLALVDTHSPCERLTFCLWNTLLFREDTLSVTKDLISWRNFLSTTKWLVPEKLKGYYLPCC